VEIIGELVDFIEHEDGISRIDPPQGLQDSAGHGTDIRPAMSADLGFIPHATQ